MTQRTVWLRARLQAMLLLPAPNRAGWYQAIRMTLAALLAYVATALVGLHHGYWAVITCLIIVQGSLGATIGAGIARLAGTAAGGVLGGLGVMLLRLKLHLPELAVRRRCWWLRSRFTGLLRSPRRWFCCWRVPGIFHFHWTGLRR
jgi:hypothetical protein